MDEPPQDYRESLRQARAELAAAIADAVLGGHPQLTSVTTTGTFQLSDSVTVPLEGRLFELDQLVLTLTRDVPDESMEQVEVKAWAQPLTQSGKIRKNPTWRWITLPVGPHLYLLAAQMLLAGREDGSRRKGWEQQKW